MSMQEEDPYYVTTGTYETTCSDGERYTVAVYEPRPPPMMVAVQYEPNASVTHPGKIVVPGPLIPQRRNTASHHEEWSGVRLWARPLGPIFPFVSGLHYLLTYGPDNHPKGCVQWYHKTEELQSVRLFDLPYIVSCLANQVVDVDDFITKLKSYEFKVFYEKSDEFSHCDPYEMIDLCHPCFKMNSLAGLELIKKIPTNQRAIRSKLQRIEDKVAKSLKEAKDLQTALEDVKEEIREVKNSLYEA